MRTSLLDASSVLLLSCIPKLIEAEAGEQQGGGGEAAAAVVFVEGSPLGGGSNGLRFDGDNNLYVCQSLGQAISKIDPETGDVLDRLTYEEDGVGFPDDVAVVGPNGTVFWSDIVFGTVFSSSDGPLYEPRSYPFANPVTASDDGTRLFFSRCFDFANPTGTGVYERNLLTGETRTVLDGVPVCASNGMAFRDEALYTPRLLEGRIVKIDLANNDTVTDVATNMTYPNAVKFDSRGRLHSLDTGTGQLVRIDMDDPDLANNRDVVAQFGTTGQDNFDFDRDDRIYVSSATTALVAEVLNVSEFRTVVPGGMSVPGGVAVLSGTLYTVQPNAMYGYDLRTGGQVLLFEAVLGLGYPLATSVVAYGDDLVLLSYAFGTLTVWDVKAQSAKLNLHDFSSPVDVHPHGGGLLVVDMADGSVWQATGSGLTERKLLLTVEGGRFLAGNEDDVYLSTASGEVVQIVADGIVVDPPNVVSSGHASPEGIALLPGSDFLLVVSAGSKSLVKVNIETGEKKTMMNNLEFLPGPPGFELGWPNDVVIHNGYAYLNDDGRNVIYKIPVDGSDGQSVGDSNSEAPHRATLATTVLRTLAAHLCMIVLSILI